jgi:predicted polyphosphate/ATP-dependent NAD kinase
MKRLGLIVNPVAGLGGRVGLKGSDGLAIQRQALALGAQAEAGPRAAAALAQIPKLGSAVELLTWAGEMGEAAARAAGVPALVVSAPSTGRTTAEDTRRAARALRDRGIDLLLFAGGDGTARDVYEAVGEAVPALGIPAGVKIHSAVYAIHPAAAGELAAAFLSGRLRALREAEVMDLDETRYRAGEVAPRLYGYLRVPYQTALVQARKSPSPMDERSAQEAIGCAVIARLRPGRLAIVGPGSTTRPILTLQGLPKTLLGVDVVLDGRLAAADAAEADLLRLLERGPGQIVVTPIGGQGHIFGRGNQPISPAVIRAVGRENVLVVATAEKILALAGRPLLVDTGDAAVDDLLRGYTQVITGAGERIVYRVG